MRDAKFNAVRTAKALNREERMQCFCVPGVSSLRRLHSKNHLFLLCNRLKEDTPGTQKHCMRSSLFSAFAVRTALNFASLIKTRFAALSTKTATYAADEGVCNFCSVLVALSLS